MNKKKNIRFFAGVLLVFQLFCVFSCKKSELPEKKSNFVTDHAQCKVEIPRKIKKIVVCDIFPLPSVLCFFYGLSENIVGIAPSSMMAAKQSLLGKMYPQILNAKTDFLQGNNLNLEELVLLNPDIVFYSATNGRLGQVLTEKGFTAVGISASNWEYNTIETLENWLILLDKIFTSSESSKKAKAFVEFSKKITDLVNARVSKIPFEQRKNVFILFQYSPTAIVTAGKHSFGNYIINQCGGINVAASLLGETSSRTSMEQIYSWNPDAIFITNFTNVQPDGLYKNLDGNVDWSGIKAVQEQCVYKMPMGLYRTYTAGVDAPLCILWFAKKLYPSFFEDIDVEQWWQDYYEKVGVR